MNGFSQRYSFLVNAEVDSMGGVVDTGVGTKPSPRQVAIEKAQAELRLEYDILEERRRELEFLEKGGDPLDFEFGHVEPLSVQSTSHTDQQLDQVLISEAKGSFALTASPHGDSVESSGRLGVTTACEPNSADNFDGENELLESERKDKDPGRVSELSSQRDGNHKVKESENSTICHPKKGQAYRRRYRSRPSRDGLRSSSVGLSTRGGLGSPLPNHQGKYSTPTTSRDQFELESEGLKGPIVPTNSRSDEFRERKVDISTCEDKKDELQSGVKDEEAPVGVSDADADVAATVKESIVGLDVECPPCSDAEKNEDSNAGSLHLNESGKMNGDGKCIQTEGVLNDTVQTKKATLNSDSCCSQPPLSLDGNGNIDSELNTKFKDVNGNRNCKEHELSRGERSFSKDEKVLIIDAINDRSCCKEEQNSVSHCGNGYANKARDEVESGISPPRHEALAPSNNHTEAKSEKQGGLHDDSIPIHVLKKTDLSVASHVSEPLSCFKNKRNSADKEHEDSVLEEARIIEAKHKRIAEISVGSLPREYHRNSCWDFVLEEMAWLANDFAQERLWKMAAAAQISHQASFASRDRLKKVHKCWMQKSIAHTMAKAVMEFWHSAQLLVENVDDSQSEKNINAARSGVVEVADCGVGDPNKVKAREKKLQPCGWKQDLPVHVYAVRFLQFNRFSTNYVKIEGSGTPEVGSNIDLPDVLWPYQLTEENLFYAVPFGATEIYRKSVESCLTETERTDISMPEGDTSMCDVATDFGYQLNEYEEDEGANIYYLPGRPSKKRRKIMNSCRSYESGHDFGYNQSILMGKRPSNSLHVDPIPTKRMRTASRPRVVGPYTVGHAGVAPTPSKADVSSGDTSFQDESGTFHGGSVVPRGSEADSSMDFEKQSTFENLEISAKPKKKKKLKHQGFTYDPRWQLVSAMQTDQNDHLRKRVDNYQLESNGSSGLFGKNTKKQKMVKQSLDSSFDNTLPTSGSVASPVASQMSNMSSQSKIIKLISGRDRGRKGKSLKVPVGQHGPGSPWSLFEDQALVVLVHDMGPNWELVSDGINSTTFPLKCLFRKPLECKERHKILMDRSSSDGAVSADDSGSSQPYPSTLQGIPKGSARQLFQQLQEPIVEDAINSHFEKIILIGQKMHLRKKSDLRPIAAVHGSHVVALSQVVPNNVNGGVLTPLDLCDAASSQDLLSIGHQGSHTSGLAFSNQGSVPSVHPPNGLSLSHQGVQGSPRIGIGNNLASSPSPFNSPRDARSSGHRPGSLPVGEQQRIQHYNHVLGGRNVQPGSFSSCGAGGRILPNGNGVGVMTGMNRTMPVPRPVHSGITSPVLNSTSMMPSNINIQSGEGPGHGSSTFRSCDALPKPGQSSDHQRQTISPEMQMQGTQSNTSGVPPFGGLNSGFSTKAANSPPVQTYPGHHPRPHPVPRQRSHAPNSPHLVHLSGSNSSATSEPQVVLNVRERQIQQRLLQQRHQLQHVQPQSLPHQQGSPHQQRQQSNRQHPQQGQLSQSQHQGKGLKGTGRSNNVPMHLNSISASAGVEVVEKADQPFNSMHGQGLYSGSPGNTTQQSKSNHSHNKKSFTDSATAMAKQVQKIPSHFDGNNQNQNTAVTSASIAPASNQDVSSKAVPSYKHQQFQGQLNPSVKVVNQSQPILQRPIQQTHQVQSHPTTSVDSASAMPLSSPCSSASSGPIGSAVNTSSLVNETLLSNSQSILQRRLSDNSVGSQWQQQQSHLQQPLLVKSKLVQKQSQQPNQQLEHSSSEMVPQQLPQPQVRSGQGSGLTDQ